MSEVVVRECTDRGEAEIIRGLLEEQGIAVRVGGDDGGGEYPNLGFAGGYQILVDEADAARAGEVLDAPPAESVEEAEARTEAEP